MGGQTGNGEMGSERVSCLIFSITSSIPLSKNIAKFWCWAPTPHTTRDRLPLSMPGHSWSRCRVFVNSPLFSFSALFFSFFFFFFGDLLCLSKQGYDGGTWHNALDSALSLTSPYPFWMTVS